MHLLDVLYKLWPIACGLVVLGVVWWRTRSAFFIFHQILKWLGLEGKYTNEDDQKVADDYLDLNKFNLKTGFHLESVKAKKKLHSWMREHDLEYAELRRAGWLFNANALTFTLVGARQKWFNSVCIVILSLLFLMTGMFLEKPNYALLKVNATGTWFWIGNNEAHSAFFDFPDALRGDAWKLHPGDCRYDENPKAALAIWDSDVICQLVLGFKQDYVADVIESQVNVAITLELSGLCCLAPLVIFLLWAFRASQLHARIQATPIKNALQTQEDAGPFAGHDSNPTLNE